MKTCSPKQNGVVRSKHHRKNRKRKEKLRLYKIRARTAFRREQRKKTRYGRRFPRRFRIQRVYPIMPPNCFWLNYRNIMNWRDGYLNSDHYKFMDQYNAYGRKLLKNCKFNRYADDIEDCAQDLRQFTLKASEDENTSENSDEYELADEMKEFLEINMRHKADLVAERQKIKEEMDRKLQERDNIDECSTPNTAMTDLRRTNEMELLYGKASPMIHGMETALQLSFNRKCDVNKPAYWPNLPLILKFSSNSMQ